MIALWDENHETKEKRLLQTFTFACTCCAPPKWIYLIRWFCCVCPAGHPLATRCSGSPSNILYFILQWCMLSPNEMRPGNSLTLVSSLVSLRRSNNLTPNGLPLLAHNQTHNCAHTWRRTRTGRQEHSTR